MLIDKTGILSDILKLELPILCVSITMASQIISENLITSYNKLSRYLNILKCIALYRQNFIVIFHKVLYIYIYEFYFDFELNIYLIRPYIIL